MKRFSFIIVISLLVTAPAWAQFRGQEPRSPSVSESMVKPPENPNLLLGIFNPDNFHMSHSISMSYMSVGGQGLGVNMYTNSMTYKISDPLVVKADVSLMFTPYGSAAKSFQNNISGIYLNRASLDYTPTKDLHISLQYRNYPMGFMPYPYGYQGYGLYGGFHSMWDRDE
jgi:hypothetical protein